METTVNKLDKKSRDFLSGRLNDTAEFEAAAQSIESFVRQRSQRSFPSALRVARSFVAQIEARRLNGAVSKLGYRVLARTLHLKGDYSEAAKAYAVARNCGRRDPKFRAAIDRALIDLHMYLDNLSEARRCYRGALATYRRLHSEIDIAMTQVSYANLLHRNDKHRDAEKLYHKASTIFENHGNEFAVARAAFNRANTLLQLFNTEDAKALYERALNTYTKLGLDFDANEARYGLAWLRMLTGDYHIALESLNDCQLSYQSAGHKRGVALCDVDMAESYLQLNLHTEALLCATKAERQFKKMKLRYETSKASFFRASAALGLGKTREAKAKLASAKRGFTSVNNSGYLGAVSLLEAQLENNESDRIKTLRVSRKLFSRAQLPLWEAICDLQIATFSTNRKRELNRLKSNKAVTISPHLYTNWKTLLGDEAYKQGKSKEAHKHWTQAADRLDSLRATLPPIELRRSLARQPHSPHQKLIADELAQNPMSSAAWAERFQTVGIWAPASTALDIESARQGISKNLADLVRRFSALSHSLSGQSGERTVNSTALHAHIAHVFNQHMKRQPDNAPSGTTAIDHQCLIDSLETASFETPFLQFHFDQERLIAFVHCNGDVRVHIFSDGAKKVERFMQEWRFILDREVFAEQLQEHGSSNREERFLVNFREWLWEPLEIPTTWKKILIIPEGELANLPWEALIEAKQSFESQRFDKIQSVVICPSLRHYFKSQHSHSTSDSVQVFAGYSRNLPAVRTEVERLCNNAKGNCKIFNEAKRDDWPVSGQAHIWHYSGHGHLRSDNPFYSYLALADAPLFAADFRLREVQVNLVTLAACQTGEEAAAPGDESSGLVRALLEMGARNVIGSRWPVSDQSTGVWMTEFYNSLFNGTSLLESMAAARIKVREDYPSAYHWSAFAQYGAGDFYTQECAS